MSCFDSNVSTFWIGTVNAIRGGVNAENNSDTITIKRKTFLDLIAAIANTTNWANTARIKVNNFTPAQLAWASQHDWFISGDLAEIKCREVYANEPARVVMFTNFQTLRDWAGY